MFGAILLPCLAPFCFRVWQLVRRNKFTYGYDFDELNNYLIECNAYQEPDKAHLKYIERAFIQKSKDDFDRALEDEKVKAN